MQDLVILVADKNAEYAIRGALERPESLGIRPIQYAFRSHPGHDGGARTTGPDLLALETQRFSHALLVLDLEGSGADQSALEFEQELDRELQDHWRSNAKSIVVDPEVDAWVWGSDNALENVIGRPADMPIRQWLQANGFPLLADGKPVRPKEALKSVLRRTGEPRSSALYRRITRKISLRQCSDPAFQRVRQQLLAWFAAARGDTV